MMNAFILLASIGRVYTQAAAGQDGIAINLSDSPTHTIPRLYGMMYEDINVSALPPLAITHAFHHSIHVAGLSKR